MKKKIRQILLFLLTLHALACADKNNGDEGRQYVDKAFVQDYSIKYITADTTTRLEKVVCDRNGYIQVISSTGLLRPRNGQFLFPGTLVSDVQDMTTSVKMIAGIGTYQDQLVYIDDKAIFSNAWAGQLYILHNLPGANLFEGGKNFTFMISNGKVLHFLHDSEKLWEGNLATQRVRAIKFDVANNLFWILGNESISTFSPDSRRLSRVISKKNISCIAIISNKLIVGTTNGYFEIDTKTRMQIGEVQQKMPCTDLTSIHEIDGDLWFGSNWGAMKLRKDGKFDYYASRRWIPSDTVVNITKGPDRSVLILTTKGLGKICFDSLTLYDKAMFYEKQVRERHIHNGFNATVSSMVAGDVTTGSMEDSENDALWTSMYLAGETFRYAVTKSDQALQNIRESLDAMERYYSMSGIPVLPSGSLERDRHEFQNLPGSGAEDSEQDRKSTVGSDEAIGAIFASGMIAELVSEPELRNQSIRLIDTIASKIVKNRFHFSDSGGQPTKYDRRSPEVINVPPKMEDDCRMNSSIIIAMLHTAYHFTKKKNYKVDHFEVELPIKEGVWNIMNAITVRKNIDLNEAIWYLQEYPLDLINWTVKTNHRKDTEHTDPNSGNLVNKEVFPPDELGISGHTISRHGLEENGAALSEISAGDFWLLPYWMGRYLEVISAPEMTKK